MDREPLYELSPCTFGGIEGQGWARYEDSSFTHNVVGAVYFDPEKADEVQEMQLDNTTVVYKGDVHFGSDVEHRSAEVEPQRFESHAKPKRTRQPYIEGHPCVEFLGPGNPFVEPEESI